MDGSRTHRGPLCDPPPVLKTGEPTGTQPPPRVRDSTPWIDVAAEIRVKGTLVEAKVK